MEDSTPPPQVEVCKHLATSRYLQIHGMRRYWDGDEEEWGFGFHRVVTGAGVTS